MEEEATQRWTHWTHQCGWKQKYYYFRNFVYVVWSYRCYIAIATFVVKVGYGLDYFKLTSVSTGIVFL